MPDRLHAVEEEALWFVVTLPPLRSVLFMCGQLTLDEGLDVRVWL